ncbi:DUF1343 domain-containing protein [soil metagenome]
MILRWFAFLFFPVFCNNVMGQRVITGAENTGKYFPLLKGKSIAVFANATSVIGKTHLVDTLVNQGIRVVKVFAPEHGFRGKAEAGEHVNSYIDSSTNVEVVSLYGNKTKPCAADLKNIDVLVFDIQDVGVRFYTYISSLQYFIEAAIENNKPIIVLDRPNPNGFYVDGPVLDPKFKSFVGMQSVPVVYGMTIGEYAKMLVGEKWLDSSVYKNRCSGFRLTVIPCGNYTHESKYILPVKPSPNLPELQSIYLYPSTCLFEGTVLNEGRGTEKPFQIFGHPSLPDSLFSYIPVANEGAKNPKLKDKVCYGWNLAGSPRQVLNFADKKFQLKWLIQAYELYPDKENFFLESSFNRLAGNDVLIKQIQNHTSEAVIRKSWQKELNRFKRIRKKYLLYKDFKI